MSVNVPNALAVFRIAMVIPIMAFTRADQIDDHYAIAAGLFIVASFTDFLDGYWARRTTGGTVLGAFLDTTADKIMVWPAAIIIFREFTVMALRGVVAQRGGLIAPSTWGKIKAFSQYAAIFSAFLRLSHKWGPWYLDQWLMLIAVVATIGSAWGYITAFWSVVRTEPSDVPK